MKTKFLVSASAALSLVACVASAATIIDYSFEAPSVGTGSGAYTYDPAVTGASFTGGAGVQANGSAWGFANAPDGSQTGFLQNNAETDLDVTGLVVGDKYSVTFSESQRPGYGVLPITVDFDGATILNTTPLSTSWTAVTTASFIAAAQSGQLRFRTSALGGDNDSGIDQVMINGGAVPEPASWALMLVGFGGLGAVARSRRSAGAAA